MALDLTKPIARQKIPYWRLSNFYFFYFASLGVLIPYWSYYLLAQGFSPLEIGELMAIIMITKVISPNIWGWIADRYGHRLLIVRIGALCGFISFLTLLRAESYADYAFGMFLFSFFWNAVLPQFEAEALNHLGDRTHLYSSIRLWGSIGFVVAVALIGYLLDIHDDSAVLYGMVILLLGIFISGLFIHEAGGTPHPIEHQPLRQLLFRKDVMALLGASLLAQASHGPYYTFYTIFMEQHGYSRASIGQLWALGVLVEVAIFMVMHRLLPRFGARNLFLVAMLLTALRWVLTALFPDYLVMVLFSQSLHAASFGVFHAVAIHLIHKIFRGRNQGMGQALYGSLSFGLGGAIGSYGSGWIWEGYGAEMTYFVAALVAMLAAIIAWRWVYERDAVS